MMISPFPIMAKYYSLVPLPQGIFSGLSLLDRAVFGLIWERWKLGSYKLTGGCEDWYDADEEEIYCIWSHDGLARATGTSEKTIRRSLNALRNENLIYWKKASYGGVCRYYIERPVQQYMNSLKTSKDEDESK